MNAPRLFPGWLPTLLAVLLLSGCATNRVNWSERIGSYRFDDAVIELGPPDKQATLQDGTIVAEWMTNRGGVYAQPIPPYGAPYWYATPPVPTYVDAPDYFLRLTFGPDGQLQAWKRFAR
jgi:hypothetical protein